MDLKGKTAIVSGAASGIGRAVALAYAREGANVIASDVSVHEGEETVRLVFEATPDAKCVFMRADVSSPSDNEAIAKAALDQFGSLDIACNNAGIGGESNLVADMSIEGWKQVIEVNLSGVFYAMRAQIPLMLRSGGGSIVNMSSILGQVGTIGAAGYVAAKHGILGLTQAAAIEYASKGLRINSVGPGYIDTPLLDTLSGKIRSELVAMHPIGRLGRAEEVANLVVWLSSDRSSFVTGSYYPIDGGYLAH